MNDSTLIAQWCWDSETGDSVLIDCRTNQEIVRKTRDGIWKGVEK